MVAYFVNVAYYLRRFRNYHGLMGIMSALEGPSVERMKLTWRTFEKKFKEESKRFQTLKDVTSMEHNFRSLREEMNMNDRNACVPYIGLYLTDIIFIKDGNK